MKVNLERLSSSELAWDLIQKYPNVVEIRLGEILKQRGLTQGDLHRLTGIRVATINEICNAKKYSMNIFHLVAIMCALRITDVREILSVKFTDEVVKAWEEEMENYDGGLTNKQREEFNENLKKMY
jgi:transcriptional regulator with XRE-family HTH domain